MAIYKTSLREAPIKHIDSCMDIVELFEGPSKKLGIAMADIKGSHGMIINDISDKVYLILEGEGRVFVGKEHVEVKPMDLVFIPPDTEHGVKGTLKLLCLMSPPFDPIHDRATGHSLPEES